MSFTITTISGGVIDKIRELPYPHFSSKFIPYVKGSYIDVPASSGVFKSEQSLPFDCEFLSIAIACNIYSDTDFWSLKIGNQLICDTIYTKQLPESVSMGNSFGIVYPVPANTVLKFEFDNVSAIAKKVWFNIKVLK